MRIIRFTAENFKRIKLVDFQPEKGVNSLGGRNKQGKSSVIDAIVSVLCGKKARPGVPLRKGTKAGKVRLELDGDLELQQQGFIAELDFDDKGKQTLVLTSEDGIEAPTPQGILDSLFDAVAFDPVAFTNLKPKDQMTELMALLGLDFTAEAAEYQSLYAKRTGVNKRQAEVESKAKAMPWHDDLPEAELDVSNLLAEQERRTEINRLNTKQRQKLEELDATHEKASEKRNALHERLVEIQTQLTTQEAIVVEASRACGIQGEVVAALKDQDATDIVAKIRDSGETNKKIAANRARNEKEAEAEQLEAESKAITAKMDELKASKTTALANAAWPVPGLGFGDDGVTFNGLPFDQASGAEQIEISAAIAMKRNPKLRVMLIRNSSLINDEPFQRLCEIAEANDYQMFIERATNSDDEDSRCTLVLEDGTVKDLPADTVKTLETAAT